jgi:hypothetical protein
VVKFGVSLVRSENGSSKGLQQQALLVSWLHTVALLFDITMMQ